MIDLIVDGTSVFARGLFASESESNNPFADPRQHAGSDYATKTILKLVGKHTPFPQVPERILFCWDGGYHKNDKCRKEKPDIYKSELAYFQDSVGKLFGGSCCVSDSAEADDLVASAAYKSESDGNVVYVASGDKDLHQIVSSATLVYSLCKKRLMDVRSVCIEWGVKNPTHVAIALALMGDRVDNIPAAGGVGKKTLAKLMQRVSPASPLLEAMERVVAGLPESTVRAAYANLEATYLYRDLPTPEPMSIKMSADAATDFFYQGDYLVTLCEREGRSLDSMLDV